MKKFFVGLLSIFVLLGATVLTACGGNNVQMELSTQSLEIQIRDDTISPTAEVIVTVTGTDDSYVEVNESEASDILSCSTQSRDNGQTVITITGISEGEGQIDVTSYQGNITKTINVVVYSEVTSMEQAQEEEGKIDNFAIRGGSVELVDSNLINFSPSQESRRTITWTLREGQQNATIEGNILTIAPEFSQIDPETAQNVVYIIATTETGISCEIKLPVIDQLRDDLTMSWSYNRDNQSYEQITNDNNTFTIVPKMQDGEEQYTGYVKLNFSQRQDLEVTRRVLNSQGEETDELIVGASGNDAEGNLIYSVYVNKNIDNLNENYVIYFEIGYSKYNLSPIVSQPIYIEVRNKVDGIVISSSDEDVDNIAGSTQVLYSEYQNSQGREYFVDITPESVIGASKEYSISVRVTAGILPEGGLSDGCPVEFWYQDEQNNNQLTPIALEYDGNVYTTRVDNPLSANRIYMKAASDLKVQSFEGIEITFRSLDNINVKNVFYAKLIKSVGRDDFVFENADFRVDSSASNTDINVTKTFTLQGQTSIDGLYIVNHSDNVTLPLRPTYVSSTEDSVTFSITLTLNRSSYGITSLDYYQICHENGLESEMFEIDIFLPLSEAVILYDTSNTTASMTNYNTNNLSYDVNGNTYPGQRESLSSIMLKNGTTTPVLYSFNSSGNYEAEATIDIAYYDFVESASSTLEMFKALISSQDGIARIIANARGNYGGVSAIANFSADKQSIITSSVGFTYAVVTFTGQSAEQGGDITIIKIILIESYVSPDGMNITPSSDRQVNLYSRDSVTTDDSTSQTITINFTNSNVTYNKIENFEFVSTMKDSSGNYVMGKQTKTEDTITWENGRYLIENVTITDSYLRFTIVTISNYGVYSFFDSLEIHYQLIVDGEDGQEVMDIMWTTIDITIRNAQRITSLIWENSDEDGIYFEVNRDGLYSRNEPYYIVLTSSPTNARNTNIAHVITDQNGTVIDNGTFINVNNVSQDTIGISLSDRIARGTTGYIYLLPEDAIYDGNISYNYYVDDQIVQSQISERLLGLLRSDGVTWYDFLVNNAFFMSNTSLTTEPEIVYFKDILLKVKITVADGSNFDYAYRIYDESAFNGIIPTSYYTVMNSLEISSDRLPIESFSGGLQGYDETITVNLNGSNFANELTENAQIRNIVFAGNVTGQGFVANINYGTINNVTIDVYQTYSSILNYAEIGYVGGIVGINNGEITNSSVLGLTISSLNSTIGGIAGQNNATISESRVEFYNLHDRNSETTTYNTFVGNIVGGIVGQATEGSSIEYSYAYNYNIDNFTSSNISVFNGVTKGAIVGQIEGQTRIYYSFGVIDNVSTYAGNAQAGELQFANVTEGSDFYWTYYNGGEYTVQYRDTNSDNLISSGDGFYEYVNNGNSHFRDLYQEEKVTDVTGNSVQTYQENGYYKSLAVSENSGILFYYDVVRGSADLTSSAQNDINDLNTISLSQLLGRNISGNIIITSSNSDVVRVIGSSLRLSAVGDITLTLSSKHDVTNTKTISIKVVYALSQMIISYTDSMDNTYQVQEGSTTYLQKTKSRQYTVTYENSTVILGNTAVRYSLQQSDIALSVKPNVENSVDITQIGNIFIITTDNESTDTIIYVDVIVTEGDYQTAINGEFRRTFTISAVDGAISFSYTGESIPLTPSTNAPVRVEVSTTAETDYDNLRPIIYYNDLELYISEKDDSLSYGDISVYHYTLPQDYSQNEDDYILTATITILNRDSAYNENTGIYSYIFEVSFSVYADYRSRIDRDIDFVVAFESGSGSNSQEVGGNSGQIVLNLTRQNFTNIDVTSFKIERSVWVNDDGVYYTAHQKGEQASVVSPGSSSILQVTANPYFAHYDYVELSYSNATVANAVDFELLQPYNSNNNSFITYKDADVYSFANTIRFAPDRSLDRDYGTLYFRVSISSSVDSDTILRFTASFFTSEGALLSQVNYYLTINYLSEPTILVDGENQSYLALGSTANVEIQVFADQVVENVILEGENIRGVNISSLSEPTVDSITGIKTYTATITSSVKASTDSDNNTISVHAIVTRTQNGVQEIRNAYATITLVDFKIDTSNVQISDLENGNLDIWLGIGKAFEIEYDILPENYNYDHSDSESVEKVSQLLQARQDFEINQYYVSSKTSDVTGERYIQYAINYNLEENRPYNLSERLYYLVGNEMVPVTDDYRNTAGARFEFSTNDAGLQDAVIIGSRQGEVVRFRLATYIYTNDGVTTPYYTDFSVTVNIYSDEDIPSIIPNATEFEKLNPDGYTSGTISQNDYILTNDIVLENHTAFNTSLIRSLDGNGYTIYIKSYNQTTQTGTLNLALFNTVLSSTTLKNVRVNIYNGGQLTIDLASLASNVRINIAGLAVTNEGVITNCEVVSFYTDSYANGTADLLAPATVRHNNPSGFNVKFIRGANTTEEVYINDGSTWTPQIAGLVIQNSGSITNSRVGGDSVTILGEDREMIDSSGNTIAMGYTYASELDLDTFYIIGQGDMAGFVLSNSGAIAASYVKLLDMENKSNSTGYDTSGFVGSNSGTVITSYVEGKRDESDDSDSQRYAYTGTSLKSGYGIIAGFVNENTGSIKDSYSNILISNSSNALNVYLASGFVYRNEGTIETSYSASQIANSRSTQMNFSGVNASGDLLANGNYINCYFFNASNYNNPDSSDNSNETLYDTGAVLITNPESSTYFYGFAIASSENDGIWSISQEDGIKLIEPNIKTYSHRYMSLIPDGVDYDGMTGQSEEGRYVLPYAILQFTDSSREINTSLGSENNPILIENAQEFVEAMGTSQSTYISQYFNNYSIWGTYRLVSDINLLELSTSITLPSSLKSFSGRLYANGFTISNLSIASEGVGIGYGLFASMESRNNSTPLISNLTLTINQVIAGGVNMVGGVAGYAKDSILINIDINFNENAQISGLNFVGGLVGLSFGNTTIRNINVTNPHVIAEWYSNSITGDYFTSGDISTIRNNIRNNLNNSTSTGSSLIRQLSNYSYAGSVIGYADHFVTMLNSFNINQVYDYSINNIRVSGTVYVQGQVAGGLFGLTAYQTNIRDAGITISADSDNTVSHILSTKYFAGGVIGQSFGGLSRIFAEYDSSVQDTIEDGLSSFYTGDTGEERGATNIFTLENSSYSQMYIGGLVGYVESGRLEVSYSKLNVVSNSADFAGGIIGGIDLTNANTYLAEAELLNDDVFTKYFLNEVYATGDVRARQDGDSTVMTAGGIIGVSYGENNRIALLAVNAFNYISNYDYNSNSFITINNSANISSTIKTNLILGSIYQDKESETQININEDNFANYLNFIRLRTNGPSGSGINAPTVAYYESYTFNNNIVNLNLFGTVNGSLTDNNLYENNYVYAINSPINFTSSEVGHSSTQQGFLSSGVWNAGNWVHPPEDLFPSIMYQKVTNFIYLDDYEESVDRVFQILNAGGGSDITIVVRGLISEDVTDEYSHVDLRDYSDIISRYPVQNFSGSIIGGNYYITDGVGEDSGATQTRVRIISDSTFIDSTGPGFYINDVIIEYVAPVGTSEIGVDTNIQGSAGLFSRGDLNEATVSSLELRVNSPIRFDDTRTTSISELNFGILAPRIVNSTVVNVTIDASRLGSNSYIVSTNLTGAHDGIYVGLIAGVMDQSSSSSTMQVDGFNLKTSANLINLSSNGMTYENIYLGGYFGQILRSESALEMQLNLQRIQRNSISVTSNQRISVTNTSATNAYIGGYVGSNNGLDILSLQEDFSTYVDIYLDDTSSSVNPTFENLYTGLIFGFASNTNVNSINFSNSSFDGGLYAVQNGRNSFVTINNLHAGGFAGRLESAMVLANIGEMNFEVVSIQSSSISSVYDMTNTRNTFESSSYENNTLSVNGYAKVGIVVGSTNASFSMMGAGSDFTVLNRSGQTIRLSNLGSGSSVGSVLGESTATLPNTVTSASTVNLTSGITSNAQFVVTSENVDADVSVGGIIGSVRHEGTYTDNSSARVTIGATNTAYVGFIGAVYSNIENINFGGIIGSTMFSNASDSISLINTSFGGVLKVYGDSSRGGTVYAGGTIGALESSATSSNTHNVTLTNAFNYGDVFVEYDETLSSLNSYVFGGLLGRISNSYRFIANNNYSMVTSFNNRFARSSGDLDNLNNALFGDTPMPASSGSINTNFYNYAVSLCTDENGSDIAYSSAYRTNGLGYTSSSIGADGTDSALSMIDRYDEISRLIYVSAGSVETGHKVSPVDLSTDDGTEIDNEFKFNGMTYATFSESATLTTQITTTIDDTTLENIAIIGNGEGIKYSIDDDSVSKRSLIDTLRGYSYVSGLVLDLDVSAEASDDTFAGIANNMYGNSLIYGVQTKGTLDIGGRGSVDVGGIVTNLYSGKILDSNTNLDIVYRGGDGGNVYGIAGLLNETDGMIISSALNKFIFNTYSTGSITSYISANLYAFSDVPETETYRIDGCYSISRLDLNDYTSNSDADGSLSVFGVDRNISAISNSFFDYNAVNSAVSEEGASYRLSTEQLLNNANGNSTFVENYDSSNIDFNYGYPTSKIGYLKTSSYARITSTTTASEGEYEYYVSETEYTRLANFEIPTDYDNVYFAITNAGLLALSNNMTKIVSGSEYSVRNFILMYDINLNYTDYSSGWESLEFSTTTSTDDEDSTEETITFKPIYFDGRERTISGLSVPLFESIGVSLDSDVKPISTIKNLRLTDANIEGYGLLAKTIYNAFVTNITLIGTINGSNSGSMVQIDQYDYLLNGSASYLTIGALANEAENSNLSAITNLVTIDVSEYDDTSNILAVGGIVGTMHNSQINYSSNYAPINVAVADNDESASSKNYFVGGLVGFVFYDTMADEPSSIRYSYNASSVMAGYANTSTLLTTKGRYFVGGLVGYSSANNFEISGCYNSGTIKSGNKSNGNTVDGTTMGVSYGGGIVGHADYAYVSNCYNEGTIEALGSSPVTEFRWYNNYLQIYQVNQRNVWAYAIGSIEYLSADLNTIQVYDNSEDSIYMNGSYLDEEQTFNNWGWNTIVNKVTATTARMDQYSILSLKTYYWGGLLPIIVTVTRGARLTMETTIERYSNDASDDVYVTSYNSFGLPTSFTLRLKINSNIALYSGVTGSGGIVVDFWNAYINWDEAEEEATASVENDEYASFDFDSYSRYSNEFQDGLIFENHNISVAQSDGDSIKRNTRSNITTSAEDTKVVSIAGSSYYIGDSDGLNAIFGAGIYNYQITESWTDLGLPYVTNRSYYSISARGTTTGGEIVNLSTYVNSVGESGITFTCYSADRLQGTINYDVSLNYDVTLNFNMSSLNYYYVNEYSFGIGVDSINELKTISDYTLTYNDVVYEDVVKAVYLRPGGVLPDKENIVTDDDFDETKDPENVDVVYFALQDDILVYIPNAELSNGKMSREVNVEEGVYLNGTSSRYTYSETGSDEEVTETGLDAFNHAVIDIINNRFANKNYYCTISGLQSRYKDISFSGVRGSAEGDVPGTLGDLIGESESGSGEIEYGRDLSNWYGSITGNTVRLSLLTDIAQAVGITSDGDVVLGYYNSTWLLNDGVTSITSGGYTFDVELDGNVLTISGASSGDIRAFLNSLRVITNDTSNTISFDEINLFDDLPLSVEQNVNITFRGEVVGNATITFNRDWTFETDNSAIVIDENGARIRSNTGLTSYYFYTGTGMSIRVYRGSTSFNYTQSYTTALNKIDMNLNGVNFGETVIYDVSVIDEDGTENTVTNAVTKPNNEAGFEIQADNLGLEISDTSQSFRIDVYSSYALTEDDLEEFYVNVHDTTESSIYSEYVFRGDLNRDSGNIENISIMFKYDDTYLSLTYDTILYTLTDEDGDYIYDESGEPMTEEHAVFVISDSNNNNILQYDYNNNRYTIYFDQNGHVLGGDEITEEGGHVIEISGEVVEIGEFSRLTSVYGPDRRSYLVRNLLTYIDGEYVPYVSKEELDGLFRVQNIGAGNYYLVISNNDYDILTEPIDFGDDVSYENQIEALGYEWQKYPTVFREYSQYQIDTNIASEYKDMFNYELGSNTNLYSVDVSGDTVLYNVFLRPVDSDEALHVYVKNDGTLTVSDSDSTVTSSDDAETCPAYSIILMNDTTFTNIASVGFVKNNGVNIIGNGYYISYYGAPFFNELHSGFIQDVYFLGENHDTLFIKKNVDAGDEDMSANLYNIKLYGSVTNFNSENGALIDYNSTYSGHTIDVTSYVTITSDINVNNNNNSTNTNVTGEIYDLTIVNGVLSTTSSYPLHFKNYGFISSANGLDGENGKNSKIYGRDGEDGEDGQDGKNIIITNNNILNITDYENHGIIKTGDGGNGGAGGSGYRATESLRVISEEIAQPGEAGSGGNGGQAGKILFNNDVEADRSEQESAYARIGIDGLSGARGRYSLTRLRLDSREENGYIIGGVWPVNMSPVLDMEAGSYTKYDGSVSTTFTLRDLLAGNESEGVTALKDILGELYTLTGDYATQYPDTSDWNGLTYDQIVANANEIGD